MRAASVKQECSGNVCSVSEREDGGEKRDGAGLPQKAEKKVTKLLEHDTARTNEITGNQWELISKQHAGRDEYDC